MGTPGRHSRGPWDLTSSPEIEVGLPSGVPEEPSLSVGTYLCGRRVRSGEEGKRTKFHGDSKTDGRSAQRHGDCGHLPETFSVSVGPDFGPRDQGLTPNGDSEDFSLSGVTFQLVSDSGVARRGNGRSFRGTQRRTDVSGLTPDR